MAKTCPGSCCTAATDGELQGQDAGPLRCKQCGGLTCALHAYIDSRGKWRCHKCFCPLEDPRRFPALHLTGGVPGPAGSEAHVVVVFHGLHICGAARHCLELLKTFNDAGMQTTMVAPQGGGQWADAFLENCNDLILLTDASPDARELSEIEWRAPRRIVSAHYDQAIAWALEGRGQQAEFFAHFHTEPEFGYFTRATLLSAGRSARRIFFPSTSTMRSYHRMVNQLPEWWATTCAVLPNALPTSLKSPEAPSEELPRGDSSFNLGIISRLDPDKLSIQFLLDALLSARKVIPRLRVRIAGNGTVGDELRHAVRQQGLAETVEILGWVNDIGAVYQWADATFLPSHSETMPYAAIESISFGCPVALPALGFFSDDSGVSPLVYTFAPGSPDDAVDALTHALKHTQPGSAHQKPFSAGEWRRKVLQFYGIGQEGRGRP